MRGHTHDLLRWKRWSLLIFVTLGLTANYHLSAQELKVKFRVPIDCQANDPSCNDVSIDSALKSDSVLVDEKNACLKEARLRKNERGRAKFAKGLAAPAPGLPEDVFCGIRAALTSICGEFPAANVASWAKLQNIEEGAHTLSNLLARLANGNPFEGQAVVETAASKPDEHHLAFCDVREINGLQGPPHDCNVIAIITPSVKLLRAELLRGRFGECVENSSAVLRISGGLDVLFQIKTSVDPTKISDSIYRTMTQDLGFRSQIKIERDERGGITHISIESTAPYRESPILKNGWRESMDFDVHLEVQSDGLNLSAYTRPMVCRQAAGNPIEYHAPDAAQNTAYASVLNDSVSRAIANACASFKQIDDKTLSCQ